MVREHTLIVCAGDTGSRYHTEVSVKPITLTQSLRIYACFIGWNLAWTWQRFQDCLQTPFVLPRCAPNACLPLPRSISVNPGTNSDIETYAVRQSRSVGRYTGPSRSLTPMTLTRTLWSWKGCSLKAAVIRSNLVPSPQPLVSFIMQILGRADFSFSTQQGQAKCDPCTCRRAHRSDGPHATPLRDLSCTPRRWQGKGLRLAHGQGGQTHK